MELVLFRRIFYEYIRFLFDGFLRNCSDDYVFKNDMEYKELGEVFVSLYKKVESKLDEERLKDVEVLLDAVSNLDERHSESMVLNLVLIDTCCFIGLILKMLKSL